MSAAIAIALWATATLTVATIIAALAVTVNRGAVERDSPKGFDLDRDAEAQRLLAQSG
jgi:hypothetical protein